MLNLSDLPENGRVHLLLRKLLINTPQTLLFEGPKSAKIKEFAHLFAKMLLKSDEEQHPDLLEVFPEGKVYIHSIQTIRMLISEAEALPFQAKQKVFLIHDADRMLTASLNALLKTLEEPIPTTIIILITSCYQDLPATITSRCFTLSFSNLTLEEVTQHNLPKEELRKIMLLSHGNLDRSIDLFNKKQELTAEWVFDLGMRLLKREYPMLKEERESQNDEEVFSYLFFFYRDLHLLKMGGDPSYLFYRDKKEMLKTLFHFDIPPLEVLSKKFEKLCRASRLNIPLSHSIYELF